MNSKKTKYQYIKRLFDLFFACCGIIIFAIPILFLVIILKLTSKGQIIYWSNRAGINNSSFRMAKLRTMKANSKDLSENLPNKPESYYTCIGKFLRKYGIDELPQLYNILIGDMSFVGPRPVLFRDEDLILERTKRGINIIKPGLTGLAQINGRHEISSLKKAEYDEYYMKNMSFILDLKIIIKTNYYLLRENLSRNNLKINKNESKSP